MSDEQGERYDRHGTDAADKPGGGALNKDNPTDPRETDEKEGGLGEKTGALGGGEPLEDGKKSVPSQEHPHGESGR